MRRYHNCLVHSLSEKIVYHFENWSVQVIFILEENMVFFVTKCIPVFAILFTLNLFTDKSAIVLCEPNVNNRNDSFSFLRLICSLEDLRSPAIERFPDECTAVAYYKDQAIDNIEYIFKLKGRLPLVTFLDIIFILKWSKWFKSLSEFFNNLIATNMSAMVLQVMYEGITNNDAFNKEATTVIQELRKFKPEIIIGVMLNKHFENSKKNSILWNFFDFYIIETTNYRECNPEKGPRTQYTDIKATVDKLKSMGLLASKMLITFDFVVSSVKDNIFEDMSYQRRCTKDMSKHRKYCYDTLQDIYHKVQYVNDNKLIGIYGYNIFNLDVDGNCGCTIQGYEDSKNPALRLISKVLENEYLSYYDVVCPDGKFPK